MDIVLWIGRRGAPPALPALLQPENIELKVYPSVDAAVAETSGLKVALAIVTYDAQDVAGALQKLAAAHPEAQVLSASDAGVPRSIVTSLRSGASGVLEFKSQTKEEILEQIRAWIGRHHRSKRERELLLRLRALNEEFLKHIVTAQKRNLELEEQLKTESGEDEDEKPRVLIVDDEEVVRGVLQTILTKKGYPHSVVHTGEAAVSAIQRERFHLVITDKNLPGIDGLEVLREVKKHSPETDVIMMTGYASMDTAIEALNQGAVGYLEKPFEHIKLVIEKIEAVVTKRKDRFRHKKYLVAIKERNKAFLDQYRAVRADLEAWLGEKPSAEPVAPSPGEAPATIESKARVANQ